MWRMSPSSGDFDIRQTSGEFNQRNKIKKKVLITSLLLFTVPYSRPSYLKQKMVLENSLHRHNQQIPERKLAVVGPFGTFL